MVIRFETGVDLFTLILDQIISNSVTVMNKKFVKFNQF